MEERRLAEEAEEPEDYRQIRRGWYWGDRQFRKERLEQMAQRRGPSHHGAELKESQEEKAEAIAGKELNRLKWNERDLEQ